MALFQGPGNVFLTGGAECWQKKVINLSKRGCCSWADKQKQQKQQQQQQQKQVLTYKQGVLHGCSQSKLLPFRHKF